MSITSSEEIEQRYAVDHTNGLYLPKQFKIYHQAELGSGSVGQVVSEFSARTETILSQHRANREAILGLLSQMERKKPLKIRIRRITDPSKGRISAEFTLKQKTPNTAYKIYNEYNLPIDDALAKALIEHIAPAILVPGENTLEYGVTKNRFTPVGPDGKIWDLDIYQGLNTGLYIAEIEVDRIGEKFVAPSWLGKRMNGFKSYQDFGTGELQNVPFQLMSKGLRERFLRAQGLKRVG